ncbi:ABC transporter ATP-binding protein [Dictyobacter aurantiacus]|uniref:Helicase n=1 Tax=Dictyobacter aurantiacus TaxID=1936993 RepID=A0A401ZB97_9CHLR|nr:ABC transporter ATP-binding protein [Dictyobacter aurantiacus]GCE03998.1 helicase [Dictyobacter aurantiacus]
MPTTGRRVVLAKYLGVERMCVLGLAVLLAATVAVRVGNPELLRAFIDDAVGGKSLEILLLRGGLFLALVLVSQGLSVATAYVSGNLAWRATNRMRLDLVRHCLGLDMAFHQTHTPGELIERTDEDVSALANLFSSFVLQILINLLLLICILIVLSCMDWRLGLALTVYVLLCLYVLRRTSETASPAWKQASAALADLHGFVGEQITGIVDLRTSGAIPYVMRTFYARRRVAFLRQWDAHRLSIIISGGTDILLTGGAVGAFLLGAALFQAGAITLGTVYLVVTYTQMLAQPLQEIMAQIDDLQKASASLKRIDELLALQPVLRDGLGITSLPAGALALACEHVSFSYQKGAPVLKDITLHIGAGEVLGVLGHTGSGKSTLARLLCRLCDPDVGSISLGGIPIQDERIAVLRQRVGMVTQEVQLFPASLRDNLTLFSPDSDDERIVQVLDELGLEDWYAALPRGLDTIIGSDSTSEAGFSAGEAQLLAFARVFLQNPSVVILDEASSRLDVVTEQLIERAVARLLQGRTGIIIAHRLATIQRADQVAILEDGQLVEYGGRTGLLADPHSRFSHLLHIASEEVQI